MEETTKPCCPEASCGCVGYGYVPIQKMYDTYDPCKALAAGTLFPELELTIREYGEVCKAEGGIE